MIRSTQLTKKQLERLDEQLLKYPIIDNKIRKRKHELENSKRGSDLNSHIKSGKISRRPEELAIIFDEDSALNCLYAFKMVVNELAKVLTGNRLEMFELRYKQGYEWEEIDEILNISSIERNRVKAIILANFLDLRGFE